MDRDTRAPVDADDPGFVALLDALAQEPSSVLRRMRLDTALAGMAAADPTAEAAVRPVLEHYLRSLDAAWEAAERRLREADPSGAMRREFVGHLRLRSTGGRPLDG